MGEARRSPRSPARLPDTDNGRRTYDKQDETHHVLRFLWVNTCRKSSPPRLERVRNTYGF